jgi:hypothetical protein
MELGLRFRIPIGSELKGMKSEFKCEYCQIAATKEYNQNSHDHQSWS